MNMTLADTADGAAVMVAPATDFREWDDFVETASGATFCHLAAWHDIVRDEMRQEPCYLAAWNAEGSICGVLPLVRLRSRLFGVRHVSVPYLNDGGALGSPEAIAALTAHAV